MLLDKLREFSIPVVESLRPFDTLTALLDYTRGLEDAEGFIVAFADGHRLKIKADQYVRIHKCLDRIRFDRNIVDLIVNEELDDVISLLPSERAAEIRAFEKRFWAAFQVTEDALLALRDIAREVYNDDRKRVALELVPQLSNKSSASFIFRMLDGKPLRELMLDHVRKSISSNTKWEETANWLGMNE
jgi:RNA ligase